MLNYRGMVAMGVSVTPSVCHDMFSFWRTLCWDRLSDLEKLEPAAVRRA